MSFYWIGSYECRAGWAANDEPLMTFRNLIAKPRKEKAKKDSEPPVVQPTQIGNDIINIEAMRYQLRTQVFWQIRISNNHCVLILFKNLISVWPQRRHSLSQPRANIWLYFPAFGYRYRKLRKPSNRVNRMHSKSKLLSPVYVKLFVYLNSKQIFTLSMFFYDFSDVRTAFRVLWCTSCYIWNRFIV